MELSMPPAKKAAVDLRFFLKDRGFDIPLAVAQEALARTRGAASFQVLLASEKKAAEAPKPAPIARQACMKVLVRIDDMQALHRAAKELLGLAANVPPREMLLQLCVEHSYEHPVLQNMKSSITTAGEYWLVTVTALIIDVRELVCEAQKRCQEVWDSEAAMSVQTAEEALYELLCASNTRCAPVDLGFEYVEHLTERT